MNDTIAAISTAMGVGAISIIRVSGENSIEIVNKITKRKILDKVDSHTITYDHIMDGEKIIDEVLISVMKAPKTFTVEDVVEINAHGGITTTNKILKTLLNNGCRLAEPGEFTKRAFLNGRIDLTQAEGIIDLINAKTEKSRKLAINQLDGKVSNLIKDLRNDIIQILANIEVNIDYPEYEDIEEMTNEKIKPMLNNVKNKMKKILNESENGKLLKEGIKTSIIGKPNVGKSSLLNRLLNEDKAIVTDIEGTTRDIVEGSIVLDGIVLNMIDTAGIRDTKDVVESIGVKKSIELINKSDLVLFVLNNNDIITDKELEILELLKDKNYILVINKCDLESKVSIDEEVVYGNTITNDGLDNLKSKIKELFNIDGIIKSDMNYLSSATHISTIKECLKIVDDILIALENNLTVDMLEIDIKKIWELLGNLIGDSYDEELLDNLFSKFCLGK